MGLSQPSLSQPNFRNKATALLNPSSSFPLQSLFLSAQPFPPPNLFLSAQPFPPPKMSSSSKEEKEAEKKAALERYCPDRNRRRAVMDANPNLLSMRFVGVNNGLFGFENQEEVSNLATGEWERNLGEFRHQLHHPVCGIYAATDVLSCLHAHTGKTRTFEAFSVRYISTRITGISPRAVFQGDDDATGDDDDGLGNQLPCICKAGVTPDEVYAFFITRGGPYEDFADQDGFDCVMNLPFADVPRTYPFLKSKRYYNPKIADIIGLLQNGPVVGFLQTFDPEYDALEDGKIFYGPESPNSKVSLLHGVVIASIQEVNGVLVARCKSSTHGYYLLVSLRSMFMSLTMRTAETQQFYTPCPRPLFVAVTSLSLE